MFFIMLAPTLTEEMTLDPPSSPTPTGSLHFSESLPVQSKCRLLGSFVLAALPNAMAMMCYFLSSGIAFTWAGRTDTSTASAVTAVGTYRDLITVPQLGLAAYVLIQMIAHNQRKLKRPLFWQSAAFALLMGLPILILSSISHPVLGLSFRNDQTLSLIDRFFEVSIAHLLPWLFFVSSFWADSLAMGTGNLKSYVAGRFLSSALCTLLAYFKILLASDEMTAFGALADVFGFRDLAHTMILMGLLFRVDPENFSFKPFQFFDPASHAARPWYFFDRLSTLKEQIHLGRPIFSGILLEIIQFYLATNVIIAVIGEAALAARYVLLQIYLLFRVPLIFGLQNAALSKVGKAFGAGDFEKAKQYGNLAIGLSALILILSSVIVLPLYREISNYGINPNNPDNQPALDQLNFISWSFMMLSSFFEAIGYASFGALNGIRQGRSAELVVLVSFIPLSLGLSTLFGIGLNQELKGYYLGHTVAMCIFGMTTLGLWLNKSRSLREEFNPVTPAPQPESNNTLIFMSNYRDLQRSELMPVAFHESNV